MKTVLDNKGQEVPSFVEEPLLRLKKMTDLRKCIKNKDNQFEMTSSSDVAMEEVTPKKE